MYGNVVEFLPQHLEIFVYIIHLSIQLTIMDFLQKTKNTIISFYRTVLTQILNVKLPNKNVL